MASSRSNAQRWRRARARYAALLTPQGKIIADFIVAAAPPERRRRLLSRCPGSLRRLGPAAEFLPAARQGDRREPVGVLGVLAAWGGKRSTPVGCRFPIRGCRNLGCACMLPPHLAATGDCRRTRRTWVDESEYDAHRIALGVPRGGLDFLYGDAFPHDADLDKLNGVDFEKAASSARRWSRAWRIAAPRAPAWCR